MRRRIVCIAFALSACSSSPGPVQDAGLDAPYRPPPDLALPSCPSTYSFATIRSSILPTYCDGASCHRMAPFAGGLDLTDANAYMSLVGMPALTKGAGQLRVKPGVPLESFLWRKLDNELPQDGSLGQPMPLGAENLWFVLPSQLRTLVYCWIQTGAANN